MPAQPHHSTLAPEQSKAQQPPAPAPPHGTRSAQHDSMACTTDPHRTPPATTQHSQHSQPPHPARSSARHCTTRRTATTSARGRSPSQPATPQPKTRTPVMSRYQGRNATVQSFARPTKTQHATTHNARCTRHRIPADDVTRLRHVLRHTTPRRHVLLSCSTPTNQINLIVKRVKNSPLAAPFNILLPIF